MAEFRLSTFSRVIPAFGLPPLKEKKPEEQGRDTRVLKDGYKKRDPWNEFHESLAGHYSRDF